MSIIATGWVGLYFSDYVQHQRSIHTWFYSEFPGATVALMMTAAPFIAMIHYYGLYENYIEQKQYLRYILMLLPFIALVFVINIITFLPYYIGHFQEPYFYRWVAGIAIQSSIMIYLPFLLFYLGERSVRKIRARTKTLERERNLTSMRSLKQQIEPHFLFNTLNAIYATAQRESAQTTLAGIEELAAILRYATETGGKEHVPVEQELKFAEQYLYLRQMLSTSENSSAGKQEINWDRQQAQIGPMLLLPLLSYVREESMISTIKISVEKGVLRAGIHYTKPGETKIGAITALTKRLNVEYDGKYGLKESNNNGQTSIDMWVDLNATPSTAF